MASIIVKNQEEANSIKNGASISIDSNELIFISKKKLYDIKIKKCGILNIADSSLNNIDFSESRVDSLSIMSCKIAQTIKGVGAKIKNSLFINESVIGGMILNYIKVRGVLNITGSKVGGKFTGVCMSVGSDKTLHYLGLYGSRVGGICNLTNSKVNGYLDADQFVADNLSLFGVVVRGKVTLIKAKLDSFYFLGLRSSGVFVENMKVGKTLFM